MVWTISILFVLIILMNVLRAMFLLRVRNESPELNELLGKPFLIGRSHQFLSAEKLPQFRTLSPESRTIHRFAKWTDFALIIFFMVWFAQIGWLLLSGKA